MINRQIVVSGLLLIAGSAYVNFGMQKNASRRKTLTKILAGGYIAILLASFADFVNPSLGALANLILIGAVVTLAWTVLPDLFKNIARQQKGA